MASAVYSTAVAVCDLCLCSCLLIHILLMLMPTTTIAHVVLMLLMLLMLCSYSRLCERWTPMMWRSVDQSFTSSISPGLRGPNGLGHPASVSRRYASLILNVFTMGAVSFACPLTVCRSKWCSLATFEDFKHARFGSFRGHCETMWQLGQLSDL